MNTYFLWKCPQSNSIQREAFSVRNRLIEELPRRLFSPADFRSCVKCTYSNIAYIHTYIHYIWIHILKARISNIHTYLLLLYKYKYIHTCTCCLLNYISMHTNNAYIKSTLFVHRSCIYHILGHLLSTTAFHQLYE